MRLTDRAIVGLKLPTGKADHIEWDDAVPCFGVRLRTETDAKVFVLQYRIGRKQRRITIGRIGKVGVDAARKHAKKLLAQVELGEDPQADKAQERIERAKADVRLGGVVEGYIEAKTSTWRPNTRREVSYQLHTLWRPLHSLPIGEISRADVAKRIREIGKANGVATASRTRAALSGLMAWAMREGLPLEQNPVIGTNAPKLNPPRTRVLSREEIRTIWNATGDSDFGRCVKLMLCTACRRQEIGSATWSEFSDDMWTVPTSRTKNGRELKLPLVGLAAEVVEAVPQHGRDFLFGTGSRGLVGWFEAKRSLERRMGLLPGGAWQLHDLRRSVVTHMAEIGIEPHIIEAVINHVSGHKAGVAGIYNRASYAPRIRQALERWDAELRSIIGGERKVLALTPRPA